MEIKKLFYSHSLGSIQLLKSTKNQIVSKAHAECEFWPQTCVVAGKCGGNYHMQMRKNDRRRSTPLRPIYTARLCRMRQAYDRPTT